MCPEISFKIAGRWSPSAGVCRDLPDNVEYVGHLDRAQLDVFYAGCRLVVNASNCYETFGLSVAEAMSKGLPVVVSRLGVFPELIQEGETGLLFRPGDAEELALKIRTLWRDGASCRKMGEKAQVMARSRYAESAYSEKLESIFRKTVNLQNETTT